MFGQMGMSHPWKDLLGSHKTGKQDPARLAQTLHLERSPDLEDGDVGAHHDVLRELEGRHVGAAPRPVHGEEAQAGQGHAVDVVVSVRDQLIRLRRVSADVGYRVSFCGARAMRSRPRLRLRQACACS